MGVDWAMESHTDSDVEALAINLQSHHIDYAFIYVSYLKADDSFNPTFDHARDFVQQFRAIAPEIKLLAWIGIPVSITSPDGKFIQNRLNEAQIREQIAEFSDKLVAKFGFDGVHIDAEPVADNDSGFISTLQAMRHQMPDGAILSLAAHALHPTEQVTNTPLPKTNYQWSTDYLKQVAENSDQIAMMAYDSGLFFPSDYRAWMAYQIRASAEAVRDMKTQLFIGVPASEEWTLSHNITTEYVANALYGVRLGLTQTADYEAIAGIAIYPYWEISDDEWILLDGFP